MASPQDSEAAKTFDHHSKGFTLVLRLITLVILVTLLTFHVRSMRVFRWEQSVSGGLLVTYVVAVLGLALGAGLQQGAGMVFQAYICSTGVIFFCINAAVIFQRWRRAGQLTRVVAELLGLLGVPLRRQVTIKVALSAAAAAILLIDLAIGITIVSK
ncbi:uncharacterized protein LOC114363359 [Ostrinia furnacalis]|uniref:uncharacterized protein LOC114363359 n=1 Tax=Ostrinia furnacalis TaxID=93504 RepID=UPI00103FB50D|nr:uncharacterized protein LOC114363359 [Ostrinia furnacalis]